MSFIYLFILFADGLLAAINGALRNSPGESAIITTTIGAHVGTAIFAAQMNFRPLFIKQFEAIEKLLRSKLATQGLKDYPQYRQINEDGRKAIPGVIKDVNRGKDLNEVFNKFAKDFIKKLINANESAAKDHENDENV